MTGRLEDLGCKVKEAGRKDGAMQREAWTGREEGGTVQQTPSQGWGRVEEECGMRVSRGQREEGDEAGTINTRTAGARSLLTGEPWKEWEGGKGEEGGGTGRWAMGDEERDGAL